MTKNKVTEIYCMECKQLEEDRHLSTCTWASNEEHVGERYAENTGPSRLKPKGSLEFVVQAGMLEEGGPVVHPKHYNEHPSGIECIDVIEYMTLNIGTAVKYLWRTGLKQETFQDATEQESAVRDLHSAIWYIEREIERIEQPFTMRKGPKAK